MKALLVVIALVVSTYGVVDGCEPKSAEYLLSAPETTPAYGVLVLRKAKVEAEVSALSEQVTNGHPSLDSKRFELRAIRREMEKMRAVETSHTSKLSSAVGNLILSKVALEVELNDLLLRLKPQHPDVTKKATELAALEREIENVLR
ncbi:MAG TPA: hypothetical protein VN844_06025 [Pyrinomonadaceae bacterium]|nr:hypothetical protein [Pyrinomonadaceae bacterium]